ncbi:hypothetical protein AKJ57_04005 [candidate division MSBL1 archaeon SCGC-AAA259A05]|uniref:tRNA (guanine(37)-N(1))-methyltransferase n=1 Tax=candidate division MSBL1 archaeon SCGC-AAA259A05 TaxID=1698259 RepID=A0A133U8X3_9EURY|nr:hypothetical protein AKJ57_04005 [candidate division MSBL1 archaeon SCGC-AAA259A05]
MDRPKNLREALRDDLSEDELEELGSSFDIVGDIAILKLPDSLLDKKQRIGEALMQVHGNLNTVLRQVGPVKGELRTRDLEVIAGESKTETTHKEYGCLFKVDLARVYFSPRLSRERFRVAQKVRAGEVVTNLFAGVGCYSILIAKHSDPEKVYSIDKNSVAVEYMRHNVRVNKTGGTVVPVEGDARAVVEEHLHGEADRVLMPLPDFARDFFDVAVETLGPEGGIVHFYDYGEEPDLFEPSLKFIREAVPGKGIELRDKEVVRSYAPRLYHVVLDLEIKSR